MPPDGADYTGKVATVSGWGRLKYGGGVPSVLQEVEVSEMSENENFISHIWRMYINLTFMICYKFQKLVKTILSKAKINFRLRHERFFTKVTN
jgi:hypothetical protein